MSPLAQTGLDGGGGGSTGGVGGGRAVSPGCSQERPQSQLSWGLPKAPLHAAGRMVESLRWHSWVRFEPKMGTLLAPWRGSRPGVFALAELSAIRVVSPPACTASHWAGLSQDWCAITVRAHFYVFLGAPAPWRMADGMSPWTPCVAAKREKFALPSFFWRKWFIRE